MSEWHIWRIVDSRGGFLADATRPCNTCDFSIYFPFLPSESTIAPSPSRLRRGSWIRNAGGTWIPSSPRVAAIQPSHQFLRAPRAANDMYAPPPPDNPIWKPRFRSTDAATAENHTCRPATSAWIVMRNRGEVLAPRADWMVPTARDPMRSSIQPRYFEGEIESVTLDKEYSWQRRYMRLGVFENTFKYLHRDTNFAIFII